MSRATRRPVDIESVAAILLDVMLGQGPERAQLVFQAATDAGGVTHRQDSAGVWWWLRQADAAEFEWLTREAATA